MKPAALNQVTIEVLARFPEVSLVYLYGSRAQGRQGPMSDYDFGILLDPPIRDVPGGLETVSRLASAFARMLKTGRIDALLLNRAPVELAYAVIASGTLLYERDRATRVEYEATILTRYADYLPVLRAQRDDILQGGKHGARVQRYRAALRRTERTLGEIKTASGKKARRV